MAVVVKQWQAPNQDIDTAGHLIRLWSLILSTLGSFLPAWWLILVKSAYKSKQTLTVLVWAGFVPSQS